MATVDRLARMGVDKPRNFDPYAMPYSHQYWFRERCWNVNMTREQFVARMARRLPDADMPAESIAPSELADFAPIRRRPARRIWRRSKASSSPTRTKVRRNRDTLMRMRERWTEFASRAAAANRPVSSCSWGLPMPNVALHWPDWLVIGSYFLLLLIISLYYRRFAGRSLAITSCQGGATPGGPTASPTPRRS